MGDEPCAYPGGALKVKGSKPGQKWVYTWNVPEAPRRTLELGPAHLLQWSERRFWRSQQVRFLIDDLKDVALPGGGAAGGMQAVDQSCDSGALLSSAALRTPELSRLLG